MNWYIFKYFHNFSSFLILSLTFPKEYKALLPTSPSYLLTAFSENFQQKKNVTKPKVTSGLPVTKSNGHFSVLIRLKLFEALTQLITPLSWKRSPPLVSRSVSSSCFLSGFPFCLFCVPLIHPVSKCWNAQSIQKPVLGLAWVVAIIHLDQTEWLCFVFTHL